MKIEIIAGLSPSCDAFTVGSFIFDRLKCLHDKELKFETWVLEPHYSKFVHYIYQILKSQSLMERKMIYWDLEEKQNIISYNKRLLPTIISKFIVNKHIKEVNVLSNEMKLTAESLIHAHWVYPHGYVATLLAKKHNVPCIVTAHGSDIHTIPRKNKIIREYTLNTLNNADKVIFVSYALLESAKELGYSGDNAVVIPNGIDIDVFCPVNKKEAFARTKWKQTERYVVGFVGNLIYVKRADKFIDIFIYIQKIIGSVEFIIVGDGELENNIRVGASDHGLKVTFTGRLAHEDVSSWMNLFDVMILPSRNESWGCVIQEAYACGIPVVGAAVGGIPENLGGLCPSVEEGDRFEERFADAVCMILKGEFVIDKKILVDNAHNYTWESCIDKEIDIYLKLLN